MPLKIPFVKIMKYLAWSDPYYFSYQDEPGQEQRNPNGKENSACIEIDNVDRLN